MPAPETPSFSLAITRRRAGFCDRIAACRTYLKDKYTDAAPYDYYIRSKSHILIHPETSDAIEAMLRVLRDEGEDAAFAYVRGLLREEKEGK